MFRVLLIAAALTSGHHKIVQLPQSAWMQTRETCPMQHQGLAQHRRVVCGRKGWLVRLTGFSLHSHIGGVPTRSVSLPHALIYWPQGDAADYQIERF